MSETLEYLQTVTYRDWLLLAYGAAILGGYIWMILTRKKDMTPPGYDGRAGD